MESLLSTAISNRVISSLDASQIRLRYETFDNVENFKFRKFRKFKFENLIENNSLLVLILWQKTLV